MSSNPCKIVTKNDGSWKCETCGIVGDRDENPEDYCRTKPKTEEPKCRAGQ